jgi:hypothetical protein
MPNTLTGLSPSLYAGLDIVSRELVGFIPSVTRNTSAERAALNQVVTYPVAPSLASTNITPSMIPTEPADITIGNGTLSISKAKEVEFAFIGEEQRLLSNGGNWRTIQADLFAQALRTLTNEIEADLWATARSAACRAIGTAGTTPFGTNTGETAQLKKILDDNGAPASERALVMDTTAGAALRTLQQLTKVNESGTTMTLRDGELLNLNNFSVKESAAVSTHTAGTAASATVNASGYAVGATVLTLSSAGTGTILAGDYVTFAGDTNRYLVVSGDADVSGGGTITIAQPGLRVAMPTSTRAITMIASSTRNIAFTRSALHLVARAPALPEEGDSAVESMMLVDPRSGIPFEIRKYLGIRKVQYKVGLAWGVHASKPAHIAALLG